jgi:hypothetical protein
LAIPQHKQQLKEAIQASAEQLRLEYAGISQALARKKEMEGHAKGTRMSPCDLLAYLVGWGELVLKWNRKTDAGESVDFPETGYKWNELGRLAHKFYSDHASDSLEGLLKKYTQVVNGLLQLVERKTNRQLYEVSWYEKWTLGRMIQLNSASPYRNARLRLRKWKKEKKLL